MWIAASLIIILFNFFFFDSIDPYIATIIIYSGINVILSVSLNLINGFTGQFSLGHVGFMAIGAYSSAFFSLKIQENFPLLLISPLNQNLVFFLALLCGGITAAIAGYIIGLPSLRLKGDYLAIVTLGFSEIIRVALLNMDSLGAARGMTNIPAMTNFLWVYLSVLFTVFFIVRLINSPHGRELLSVREDEHAAESCGVNTTAAKIKAFVTGSFFAGAAGGLFAHYLTYLNPAIFDISKTFEVIIMVVLGGLGSISGSVIAAILLTVLKEALRPLQDLTGTDYRMVIYSFLLIILMLTRPRGIFGNKEIFSAKKA
jgi:branched-chain amino acid transport system permease protein